MQLQPVDDIAFWKKRIEDAPLERPHYSVYITNPTDWDYINRSHERLIRKFVMPDHKVLDAGCGYGRLAPMFQHYLGIDFSPDFISIAKQQNPSKSFKVVDLKDMPFKDKGFDWAVVVSIKDMIKSNLGVEAWLKMETELKRVAKNVLLLEYTNPQHYETI